MLSEKLEHDIIYIQVDDEELLTKKELCERILKCDVKTAEKHFLFAEGFPYFKQGDSIKYPKRQVEEWIQKNTKYN